MAKRRSDELAAVDEVMPLVDQFNALNDNQQAIFLDMVDPLPDELPTKPVKRKGNKKAEKSRRAASLAGAIGGARPAADAACAFTYNDGKVCGQGWPNAIHDPGAGYAGYHPFQSPQPATRQSSRSGEAASSTASSEAETDAATVAARAAGEGE